MKSISQNETSMQIDYKKTAEFYIKNGFSIIPIPYRSKKAVIKKWQTLRINKNDVPKYFNGKAQNIGLLLGDASNGIIDIDLDCPEAISTAQYFLPNTITFGRKSKPKSHYLYKLNKAIETMKFQDSSGEMLVELRSTGCQTVIPPSVHEEGELIEFTTKKRTIKPLVIDSFELQGAVMKVAASALVAKYWNNAPSRNHATMYLAGGLFNAGWRYDDVVTFIEAVIDAAGDNERKDRIGALDGTFKRFKNNEKITGFPTLSEAIGDHAVSKMMEWLQIKKKKAESEEAIEKYFYKTDKGFEIFKHVEFANDLLEEFPCFRLNSVWFYYDNGVYKPNGQEMLRKIITERLGEKSRRKRVTEVLYHIESIILRNKEEVDSNNDLINVKNGLLDWKTGELKPHTPDYLSVVQIPVIYNPKATGEKVKHFFLDVLHHDTVKTMVEWFSYCLMKNCKYKKATMLTGIGDNGKSVLIDLLITFLGRENVTNIPLQDLEHNRFYRASLQGKLANAFADIPSTKLEKSSTFKALVAGDPISAEQKGRDPFELYSYAKMIYSANEKPSSRDTTEAFYKRWLIIPFPNQFTGDDADPYILEKITTQEELSGLLNLVIDGMKRLEKNKGFTIGDTIKQALADYRKETDVLSDFIEECCNVDFENENMKATGKQLYDVYRKWAKSSGFEHTMPLTAFGKKMGERFKKTRSKNGIVYKNIGIKYDIQNNW